MLERLIEYINGHDGVRWMTFEEIADDFAERHPRGGLVKAREPPKPWAPKGARAPLPLPIKKRVPLPLRSTSMCVLCGIRHVPPGSMETSTSTSATGAATASTGQL